MSRALSPADRAAIDAAVAAGRVTSLPSGLAAGLSPLESNFGPVSARAGMSWRDQIKQGHAAALQRARNRSKRRAG